MNSDNHSTRWISSYVFTSLRLEDDIPVCRKRSLYNGNRTEWSVIIRVFNKIGGVRFVNHKYDYRTNWTTRCPVTN